MESARALLAGAEPQESRLLAAKLVETRAMLQRQDRLVEAVQVAHDAVAFRRALVQAQDQAHEPGALAALAQSLRDLACALSDLGQVARAAEAAQEEVALRRDLARDGAAGPLLKLGVALRDRGRWLGRAGGNADQALRLLHEALAILCPLADAGVAKARLDLARTHYAHSSLLGDRRRDVQAIPPGLRAVAMLRELARTQPHDAEPELAKALHNVSIWLSRAGRLGDGLAAAQEATSLYRRLAGAGAPETLRNLAWSLVTLGNRLVDADEHGEAQAAYREAGALVLRMPVHDAHWWAWLAGIPVAMLSQPRDLRDFHLPLLRRVARAEFVRSDEAARALAALRHQIESRVRTLMPGCQGKKEIASCGSSVAEASRADE